MIQRMLAIWSLVPLPLWNPACAPGSSWFTNCWSLAWRILSITLPSMWKSESENCSVTSDSSWHNRLYSPWNFPGQNTGIGSCSLLQGILPTQRSNPGLPHCRWILYCLSHQVSSVGCSNKLANPGRGSWEPLIYIWSVRIIRSNLGLEKGVWIGNSLVGLSS